VNEQKCVTVLFFQSACSCFSQGTSGVVCEFLHAGFGKNKHPSATTITLESALVQYMSAKLSGEEQQSACGKK